MALSSCDIGNPIYDKAPRINKGEGVAKAEIWFSRGDRSEFHDVDYSWEEWNGNYTVVVINPIFGDEYIVKPDDLEFDCKLAVEEDLGHSIEDLTFVESWKQ